MVMKINFRIHILQTRKTEIDVIECKQRSLSYSAALKANLRLVVYEIDTENNTKQILSAKSKKFL